jgi:GntR family transcriptional regulator/MocR family aminotransferase
VLDRHLRKTRPKYNRRRHALITALRSEIEGVEISSAPAGLHLLARFPGPCSEERLVAEAARRSVYVLHLSKFLLGEVHDRRPTLVLGYANTSEDAIVAGVRELRRAWECVR